MVEVRESRQQKIGSVEQRTVKIVGTSCKIATSQNYGRKSVLVMSGATDHHTKECPWKKKKATSTTTNMNDQEKMEMQVANVVERQSNENAFLKRANIRQLSLTDHCGTNRRIRRTEIFHVIRFQR